MTRYRYRDSKIKIKGWTDWNWTLILITQDANYKIDVYGLWIYWSISIFLNNIVIWIHLIWFKFTLKFVLIFVDPKDLFVGSVAEVSAILLSVVIVMFTFNFWPLCLLFSRLFSETQNFRNFWKLVIFGICKCSQFQYEYSQWCII